MGGSSPDRPYYSRSHPASKLEQRHRLRDAQSFVRHPIERDTVGGEVERLIDRDALQTGFVGSPGPASAGLFLSAGLWNYLRCTAISHGRHP